MKREWVASENCFIDLIMEDCLDFLQSFSICLHLDRKCNPSLLQLVTNNPPTTAGPTPTIPPGQVQWWDAQGIVGLVIFLFCTLYAR